MSTHQGDVSLLHDPVAQRLLGSKIPCRLAYVWSDGTPRVVPINFHWNGSEIVVAGPTDAPKMKVLRDGMRVALTIDSNEMPYKVLMVRGPIRIDEVEGIAPEYAALTFRVMGEEAGQAWLDSIAPLFTRMARIFITPEWVGVMDFEGRFPSAVEHAMERAHAAD